MPLTRVVFEASAGLVKSLLRITESQEPVVASQAVALGQNDSWWVPFVCIKRTSAGGVEAAGAANALSRKAGTARVAPAAFSRSRRENCGRNEALIGPPCARRNRRSSRTRRTDRESGFRSSRSS